MCTFHALGANITVTPPPGVTFNPSNSLVTYAIGKNPVTGAPSTVDFDAELKVAPFTGIPYLTGPIYYSISTGPYIVNSTTYGSTHPPATWSVPGDSGQQVTPSQYKLVFNANTGTAKHTGDFNGGENGNIPGATGCPNMPGVANCEAVVVTGNVPSGIYEQKVRLFNYWGAADPKVELQVGAYVTGQLVIVNKSHKTTEEAQYVSLQGTGSTTPVFKYEIYNREFEPHVAGTATFDRMNWGRVRNGGQFVQNGHRFVTKVQDSTTTRIKVYGDTGWAEQKTWVNKPKTVGYVYVGEVPPPVPTSPAMSQEAYRALMHGTTSRDLLSGFLATNQQNAQSNQTWIEDVCVGAGCPSAKLDLTEKPFIHNPNYTGAMAYGGTLSNGSQAWMSNPYYVSPEDTSWWARHNRDQRTQAPEFVVKEFGKGAAKSWSSIPVAIGTNINAGYSGIGAFAGTIVGDAWYSGDIDLARATQNAGEAVDQYKSDRTELREALQIKNTSQEAGSLAGMLGTFFIPVKGITTRELTPSIYPRVAPVLAPQSAGVITVTAKVSDEVGAILGQVKTNSVKVPVGSRVNVGPWSEGITNVVENGTFTQCGNGSCISATAQVLTNGAVTEAQVVARIGEWADPLKLPGVLNELAPAATQWRGVYFRSGEEALAAASRGTMGAVLQAPGRAGHMVTISPIQGSNGLFRVQDTGVGKTYDVTSSWVKQYVSLGVWK